MISQGFGFTRKFHKGTNSGVNLSSKHLRDNYLLPISGTIHSQSLQYKRLKYVRGLSLSLINKTIARDCQTAAGKLPWSFPFAA